MVVTVRQRVSDPRWLWIERVQSVSVLSVGAPLARR